MTDEEQAYEEYAAQAFEEYVAGERLSVILHEIERIPGFERAL